MRQQNLTRTAAALITALAASGCDQGTPSQSMEVTATAYTLAEEETKQGNIGLAAWGDRLKPGMKSIAVSRDLIQAGLDHVTEVQIDGLPGTYTVRDKMNKRWEKKIDIFMGNDVDAAREWGKRKVTIRWNSSAPWDQ